MKLITGRNGSKKVVVGDVNVKKVQHKHKNFHQTFFYEKEFDEKMSMIDISNY